MTVKALIEELSKLDPSATVVMSKDAEGNWFSPLDDFETGRYQPETTWSGFFYDQSQLDEEGIDLPESSPLAVCLWPVN